MHAVVRAGRLFGLEQKRLGQSPLNQDGSIQNIFGHQRPKVFGTNWNKRLCFGLDALLLRSTQEVLETQI